MKKEPIPCADVGMYARTICMGVPLRNGASLFAFPEMPRYFCHLQGARPYQDNGGVDLPNDAAAWAEAKRYARDIERNLEPDETWYLEVRRDDQPIYSLKICAQRH